MLFERINPDPVLEPIIECFWIIENEDPAPVQQKIIPDGFTEFIFHFKEPYMIKTGKQWKRQSNNLVAGQIRKHFLLKNTGKAGVLGVKFKPASLTQLFGLDMHLLTDRVAGMHAFKNLLPLADVALSANNYYERIGFLNEYFINLPAVKNWHQTTADTAVELIFKKNGMVSIPEICAVAGTGERQLENIFKKFVGLSPKFFCRIIRFNYIFQLVQRHDQNWTSLAYEAAYYDQSHFIRNFRSFTGEKPSGYSFDEKNMANFFLRK